MVLMLEMVVLLLVLLLVILVTGKDNIRVSHYKNSTQTYHHR